jgi:hypothetical protein
MLTINQHDIYIYAQAQLTRFVTDDSRFGNNLPKQPVNRGFDIAETETETNGVEQAGDQGRI